MARLMGTEKVTVPAIDSGETKPKTSREDRARIVTLMCSLHQEKSRKILTTHITDLLLQQDYGISDPDFNGKDEVCYSVELE